VTSDSEMKECLNSNSGYRGLPSRVSLSSKEEILRYK